MGNTKVEYLYRDASNNKVRNCTVIRGMISTEQINTIMGCLYDGEYFIPRQVGLPEERFSDFTEDDHPWFELSKFSFSHTDRKPSTDMGADEFVRKFIEAKNNWNEAIDFD